MPTDVKARAARAPQHSTPNSARERIKTAWTLPRSLVERVQAAAASRGVYGSTAVEAALEAWLDTTEYAAKYCAGCSATPRQPEHCICMRDR